MKCVALVSFCGAVSMAKDEVRDISDLSLARDLISAGYVKEVKKAVKKAEPVKEAEPKKAEPKKTEPVKKTQTKKTATKKKTSKKK